VAETQAKRCTNRENMHNDEAIAEDCMLKAFRCGESGYAVREHDNKMRARGPRPYLDKNKQSANSPECHVGAY
jgi:hypothetical protein